MLTVRDIIGKRYTPEDFIFFWLHTGSPESCFSQWYPSPFVIDGVSYNCAEQYMMAMKASIFGDTHNHEMIMATYNPMEMKKLGRKVSNFDDEIWKLKCDEIVKEANLAKFAQNTQLRNFLLSTGDRILVEASPFDTIWGIGLEADNSVVCHPECWRGENRLGFILMEVRDSLRKQMV